MAISKAMQNYCGGVKNDDLLIQGIDRLLTEEIVPSPDCNNPHELMRTHEVLDILDVSEMILQACLMRKSSSKQLCFYQRSTQMDPKEDHCFITIRQENGVPVRGTVSGGLFR